MAFLAPITHRNWLGISGKDSFKFLQALTTQNLYRFNRQVNVLPSLFLNSNGRVNVDCLLISVLRNEQSSISSLWSEFDYIIDHHKNDTSYLLQTFQKRLLRHHLSIIDLGTHITGFQLLPLNTQNIKIYDNITKSVSNHSSNIIHFLDPRLPSILGRRILANIDDTKRLQTLLQESYPDAIKNMTNTEYKEKQMSWGIIEHQDIYQQHKNGNLPSDNVQSNVQSFLPIQLNYDWYGYLAQSKGCYVGQEVIAKTFVTQMVRRRIFIFNTLSNQELHYTTTISIELADKSFHSIGYTICSSSNYIIGIINIRDCIKASVYVDQVTQIPESIKTLTSYQDLIRVLSNFKLTLSPENIIITPSHLMLESHTLLPIE